MKVFFLLLYCHLLYKSLECSCTTHTVVTSIFWSKKNVQAELTINLFSGMFLGNNCSWKLKFHKEVFFKKGLINEILSFMIIYSLGTRISRHLLMYIFFASIQTCNNCEKGLFFSIYPPSFHHQAFMTLGKRRSCVARLELFKRLYTYSQTYLPAFSSFLA